MPKKGRRTYKWGNTKITYKSRALTGVKKTGKVFGKSKIKSAKKGQLCINTSTGHVYKCMKAGKPSVATWAYIGTLVMKEPATPVKSLKLVRRAKGARNMDASWKVPDALGDSTNRRRASGLAVAWSFTTNQDKPKSPAIATVSGNFGLSITSRSLNLGSFTAGGRSYTRQSFHPHKSLQLKSVTVTVTPYNSKGKGTKTSDGKSVPQVATFKFAAPRNPTIDVVAFNTETGVMSTKVTAGASDDACERWDTVVTRTVTLHRNEQNDTKNTKTEVFTGNDKSVTYDAEGYAQLGKDDYYHMRVTAYSRGIAGNSATVTRDYYVSFPKPVTINDKPKVTSRDSSGKVIVSVTVYPKGTNKTIFPVDHIKLQRLSNVPYASASAIPGGAEWEDTGMTDNAACEALTCSVADVMPDRGNHSWLRVKAWHASEDVLFSYSKYVEVDDLFVAAPTAADDKCEILSCTPGEDGESVEVVVGFDAKDSPSDDDATGTQVGWSEDEDAWKSTEQPTTFDIIDAEWDRESIPSGAAGYNTWKYRETLLVRGLTEGTKYNFRARRFMEDENATTYGKWCDAAVEQTTTTPPSVMLVAPTGIERGRGLDLAWVFAGHTTQAHWEVRKPGYAKTADTAIVAGKSYYTLADGVYTLVATPVAAALSTYYERRDVILDKGDDARSSHTVAWERIAEHEADGRITVCVDCSTGSAPVESDWCDVVIADRPEIIVAAPTLIAQPATITVEGDAYPLDVTWSIVADNDSATGPDGATEQYRGDVVAGGLSKMTLAQVTWADSVLHARYAEALTDAQAALAAAQAALDELEEGDEGYDEAVQAVADATADVTAAAALEATEQVRYQGTIALEPGREFHDNSSYVVTAQPTDRTTGLTGDAATSTFAVAWAHQAPVPPKDGIALTTDTEIVEGHTYYTYDATEEEYVEVESPVVADLATYYVEVDGITVTPYETVTDDGITIRGCTIALVPPEGAALTDVYDVYRITHDGLQLISLPQGYALDATVNDQYAPFGDAGDYGYRIACRTADGDVEWRDYDYYADAGVIKVDFGGSSVELPYNIVISDSYTKDVDIRAHMDGTVEAFHNAAIRRKGSLSTDVMRVEDADDAALVRALARYAGTAFVRTPDGSAYEADVQVSGMNTNGPGVALAVSIDAQEVALAEDHMLTGVS